jgi:hypothetical protein
MNRQSANLCLIVVLVSAWTDGLMGGSFLVAPQEDNSFLGQEIYPLALRDRAESRLTVEAPAPRSPDQAPLLLPPLPSGAIYASREQANRWALSGAEARYLFMSIQR